ncbi:hypothetical protein [Cupriavidus consociatus]|uniref:hypothetical protein n=1 Tax=Cupriavidus consociatus TaxID=2821357 RepID=UPI001AE38FA9|nr:MULTISPECIES: hypothetical protein [unclassified Cupriavidus]MBP0624366.1 hypothetical protein [Cupriavidus sp. LEh25]MDK2661081.1 hypothetical protein [Cupriavidus sp. LEh21]
MSAHGIPAHITLGAAALGTTAIRNLQFPLPVRIDVESGACELSMRGFTRTIRHGEARLVPALEEVSLTLLRQARVTLTMLPECGVDPGRERCRPSTDDSWKRRPATAGLSLAVFASPQLDWGLSSAAACLGKMDGRSLSRKLLQECSSLRQVVKTQRLSRFLFDLMASARQASAASYGFPDQCRLENAVYDQFGISISALSRLSPQPARLKGG